MEDSGARRTIEERFDVYIYIYNPELIGESNNAEEKKKERS